MKDLEIRGAGNLLGGEQSGHIEGVGFDLYVRLVGEAVAEFRGEQAPESVEMKVELPVDAHLPHDYVPGERLRLEAYRKIAEVSAEEGIQAIREELQDRYGPVPEPVENLLAVARLRIKARRAGLTEIAAQGNQVRFGPVDLPDSAQMRLKRLYPGSILKPAVGHHARAAADDGEGRRHPAARPGGAALGRGRRRVGAGRHGGGGRRGGRRPLTAAADPGRTGQGARVACTGRRSATPVCRGGRSP